MRPPPSSGGIATNAAITIVFDHAVNERSVEERIRVRDRRGRGIPGCSIPAAARGAATGCRFRWRRGRIVRLEHARPLRPSTTYRVALASGFAGRSGVRSTLDHSWLFVTEAPPAVTGTDPGPGGVLSPIGAPAISFSRAMRAPTVAAAVTLRPTPPGGVVVLPNRFDPTRFLVEPRAPLVPGTVYTLRIARAATDVHGNRLPHGLRVRFTAGGPGSASGVVFPAGVSAGRLTEVLAAVPPAEAGDPATIRLLYGSPGGRQILHVWPSTDGRDLVVQPAGRRLLRLVDLRDGSVTTVPDSAGALAGAWSADGGRFAYIAGGALRVYGVDGGGSVAVAGGPAVPGLRGPISWRPDGALLAAVLAPAGAPARIVLCSPILRALTTLPAIAPATASEGDPVWSPDGSALAFAVSGPHGPHLWWYRPADAASPVAPIGTVPGTPIVFLDPDSILAHGARGGLERVAATTGSEQGVVGPARGDAPVPATASVAGRVIAYTRVVRGYAQIALTSVSGAGTVPLTAFGPADPLQAGAPAIIGPLA